MAGAPKIIVLSEQLRGQSFELTKERYALGRLEECDICIPDPTVSSHHCTLTRKDERVFEVTDEGSTNGTRVNGIRVEDEPRALENSDILQVGGVEMLFDAEQTRSDSAPSTQTVIDLENTHTGELPVREMSNFSPFSARGRWADSRATMFAIGIVLGLLIVAVVAALGFLMFKLFS